MSGLSIRKLCGHTDGITFTDFSDIDSICEDLEDNLPKMESFQRFHMMMVKE